ncbi:MAG: phosphotransferase, partial [Planctomycetota bacterium]
MKKIDLHLHTLSTISDSDFVFSIDKLEEYVSVASIDAIAITNHNVFDLSQYESIRDRLKIAVFPGIEIDLEGGHVLLVTDDQNADRLHGCSDKVSRLIRSSGDDITHEQLLEIFGDLKDFLVIPHYEKKPPIRNETLEKLNGYVTAGEVDSAKKFIRCAKDHTCLTPVLFSDARMKDDLQNMPTRSTFVDCGEITLSALRHCLSDRRKVALSKEDGNESIQVLDTGLSISTGLNVLLGDRSSGKTYTLDRMSEQHPDAKYISQFSLVQVDERKCEQKFNADIERRKSFFADEYLSKFKPLVEEVSRINLKSEDELVQRYLETLIESARNADRQDVFSRAKFFNETTFKMGEDTSLKSLIQAVRHLIENV